ncbi:MAG: metallophosphoesterase [Candidatus Thermoplasmatota archaeon]
MTDDYCLYLSSKKTVVISDLHLGLEGVLRSEGLSIPQYQKKVIVEKIKKIVEKYKPKKILVNGDFKHEFGKNLSQEWREISEILDFLSDKVKEIILIRGNHDNFLQTIAVHSNVPFKKYYKFEDSLFIHGHKRRKKEYKRLIIGHEHPFIKIRDKVGATLSLPCYLYSEELIVLPAFSPLASGTDMTAVERKDLLSPVLKDYDISRLKVVAIGNIGLLDFSKLGKLRKLKM